MKLVHTVFQAIKTGHVRRHLGAAQDVIAHNGVLGVGEGYLLHLRPRSFKHVSNTTPLSDSLLRQPWGVVLLTHRKRNRKHTASALYQILLFTIVVNTVTQPRLQGL